MQIRPRYIGQSHPMPTLTLPHSNLLTCLQWNARNLTKARLEESRGLLSSVSPSVVLSSETHSFNIKFKNYIVIKKDRQDRQGGGVAILMKKSLQFPFLLILYLIN